MKKIYVLLLLMYVNILRSNAVDFDNLKLKQVLILSRHSVRAPLGTILERISPKAWPKFEEEPGKLTKRGALLENLMGEYFAQWFQNEHFFPEGCPDEDAIYVYTNTIVRTQATAKAFLESAFKNCNVPIHHLDTEEPDPIFNPVIHNSSEAQKSEVIEEIYKKLDNSKLYTAFTELNHVLDIQNSEMCKKDLICDLADSDVNSNTIFYEVGKELVTRGPLYIGNSALDSFLMSYYNGLPMDNVAWGLLNSPEKWDLLTEISRQDQYIRYSTVAEDIAGPLLKNLYSTFSNFDVMPKIMLIVGHDFNLNSITNAMGFKSIEMPNQYEAFPIGGKLVFQRWTDGKKDYLKVEYVYQTWSQLRNATKLCLENPPQRNVMMLKWCRTNRYGFCEWKKFVNQLVLK